MSKRTVRVYGFLEDAHGRVLVSAERFRGKPLVKYPGGGVEWGEGIREALVREFQEELKLDVTVGDLVYFNEFPVVSAFDPEVQVFSFFYRVVAAGPMEFTTYPEVEVPLEDGERAVWVPLAELATVAFTYMIEQEATKAFLAASF
jgi:ADP-ribose pyrophosphatase YjhB (NUDIX family)